MEKSPVIHYEALVEAYRGSLTSVLRGFRPGEFREAFLETWVPDHDDAKSFEGLLEAASAARVGRLVVKVGRTTLDKLPAPRLEGIAQGFGAVATSHDDDATVFDVVFDGRARDVGPGQVARRDERRARAAAPSAPLPAESERACLYDAALQEIGPFTHEGTAERAGATRITADHEGATLDLLVDTRNVIVAARHRGGAGGVPRVLEALCRIVESLPLREAADHGAARLELALRGRDGRRVVPGIVSPDNADPRVGACARTLRELLSRYAARTGGVKETNEFVPPLRADWAGASQEKREALVRAALEEIAPRLALGADDVGLATVHGDTRVVVAFGAEVPTDRRPGLLFEIERALKTRIDDSLTVYLEEMADANRLRRLKPAAELLR